MHNLNSATEVCDQLVSKRPHIALSTTMETQRGKMSPISLFVLKSQISTNGLVCLSILVNRDSTLFSNEEVLTLDKRIYLLGLPKQMVTI